ncbi:MAG: hypothetical protein ACKO7B_03015, partial [Flavobacteriales bacterium]
MNNSKLLALSSTLTQSEWQDLVSRPITKGSVDRFNLCKHIHVLQQSGQLAMYDRIAAFKELFPNAEYDDQRMRLVESALLRELEYFLVEQEIKKDEEMFYRMRLKVYNDRNLAKNFRYAATRHNDETEASVNGERWYHKYTAARSLLSFDSRHVSRKKALAFSDVVDSLDTFFVASKLMHACEIINARNVMPVDAELRMMEVVRQFADEPPFSKDPAVCAYRMVYDSLMQPDDESFVDRFADFLQKEGRRFPYAEQREFFQYLKNFCVKKLNTGRTEYTRRLFEIYKLNLADKQLLADEPMSPFEFKNIVTIALRLGEFKWVKAFIPSHLSFLDPEHRANAELYNQANLHYFMKDYKTTFRLLQKVEFNDVFYALDARSILLKSCF